MGSWQLENRNGATFHNGKELQPGDVVNLACYDRIVLGGEITLFVDPAIAAKFEEPPVDMAFEEYVVYLAPKFGMRFKQHGWVTDGGALEYVLGTMVPKDPEMDSQPWTPFKERSLRFDLRSRRPSNSAKY